MLLTRLIIGILALSFAGIGGYMAINNMSDWGYLFLIALVAAIQLRNVDADYVRAQRREQHLAQLAEQKAQTEQEATNKDS